ncbi:hypothetical protein ACFL1X_01435 [Candidatus Hydrogenedentota bacterium]
MKLTHKDKAFLERLRALLDGKGLRVELRKDGLKRLVLRRNYGTRVETHFGMSRQGVRWRFQRLMDMYVSAYETILFIESNFGVELRGKAMAIAKQRVELRKRAKEQSQHFSSEQERDSK